MSASAAPTRIRSRSDAFNHPVVRAAIPFLNGGAAGMIATSVIQPVDMVKVRLQLAGEGVSSAARPSALSVTQNIIKQGRFLDLYAGLSAGLLRQAVYVIRGYLFVTS
jgi:solute carrier family 25 oxoglutarate transporter 11